MTVPNRSFAIDVTLRSPMFGVRYQTVVISTSDSFRACDMALHSEKALVRALCGREGDVTVEVAPSPLKVEETVT